MASEKISSNLFWVGSHDPHLRRFDIVMETKYGSTYNSYIFESNGEYALIDGSKLGFEEEWLGNIKEVVAIEKISTMVVQHTEPDHSSAIAELLKINPNIQIYGSPLAMANLREIVNHPFNAHVIKDGEKITIGDDTLEFIVAPNLHWPDTIFTYIEKQKYLFTCDFFGAHICVEPMALSAIAQKKEYAESFKVYFDAIMSPFKPFVRVGLAKIKNLKIDYILNSHGPYLDSPEAIRNAQNLYQKWAEQPVRLRKKVTMVYCSNYGYTKLIAEAMAEAIKEYDVEFKMYDIVESATSDMVADIEDADGILFGSPTIVADVIRPVYDLMNELNPFVMMNKIAGAFGSYGWSGEAVGNLLTRAKQLKMKTIDDGFKVRLNPTADDLVRAKAYAANFVNGLY
ncbi:MAG: FprA family A-type flavoprotein [Bacilli bacterium]